MSRQVRVWRQSDGWWRWRYVETRGDDADVTLTSNEAYDSEHEALDTARAAYPGVEVWGPAPQVPAEPARRGRLAVWVVAAGVVLLYVVRRRSRSRKIATTQRFDALPAPWVERRRREERLGRARPIVDIGGSGIGDGIEISTQPSESRSIGA